MEVLIVMNVLLENLQMVKEEHAVRIVQLAHFP